MARNMKKQLKLPKSRVGYSSHGVWPTLENIMHEEADKGNWFPKLNFMPETPAIWICLTPRKALRYAALAEEWTRLNDETQPLTTKQKEMLESITKIRLRQTDIIAHNDEDGGYLVLRQPKKKRQTTHATLNLHTLANSSNFSH